MTVVVPGSFNIKFFAEINASICESNPMTYEGIIV